MRRLETVNTKDFKQEGVYTPSVFTCLKIKKSFFGQSYITNLRINNLFARNVNSILIKKATWIRTPYSGLLNSISDDKYTT